MSMWAFFTAPLTCFSAEGLMPCDEAPGTDCATWLRSVMIRPTSASPEMWIVDWPSTSTVPSFVSFVSHFEGSIPSRLKIDDGLELDPDDWESCDRCW